MTDDHSLTPVDKAKAGGSMLYDVLARVDKAKPTKEDRAELARILKDTPAVWRVAGDLAANTNITMVEKMQAPLSTKMSLRTGLKHMVAELTQPDDGALEQLIINQIVGAWLRLSFVEYSLSIGSVEGSFNIPQAEYWERRVSSAQRRYLRAIETLARVRRLRLPSMQINIGAQQVNQVN